MYLRFYRLRDKPFKLVHDPAYYYSAAHQIPLNELCYSIEEHQGLATLVGEPGTGKTTLLRRLLQSFGPDQSGVFMSDASLGGQSIIRQVEAAVGVVTGSEVQRAESLVHILTRNNGTTVVILIDEAQGLSPQQLEEVRYLTNLEAPGRKLLEIVLSGQPPLLSRLATPELAALRQRVVVQCRLEPLDVPHTKAYIEHRLRAAGARDIAMFEPEALEVIHDSSRGIPRLINIICERCLVVGYASDVFTIDGSCASEAVADLQMELEEESDTPPAPQPPSDSLVARLGSRLETIEEKLDLLLRMLNPPEMASPELAETIRTRKDVAKIQQVQKTTGNESDDISSLAEEATATLKVEK